MKKIFTNIVQRIFTFIAFYLIIMIAPAQDPMPNYTVTKNDFLAGMANLYDKITQKAPDFFYEMKARKFILHEVNSCLKKYSDNKLTDKELMKELKSLALISTSLFKAENDERVLQKAQENECTPFELSVFEMIMISKEIVLFEKLINDILPTNNKELNDLIEAVIPVDHIDS